MSEPQLFIMALFAMKPDPEQMNVVEEGNGQIGYQVRHREGMNLSSPIFIAAHVDIATSPEDAKQYGLECALEMWPRKDGWVAHSVAVTRVSKAEVMELLDLVPEKASPEDTAVNEETEELIM